MHDSNDFLMSDEDNVLGAMANGKSVKWSDHNLEVEGGEIVEVRLLPTGLKNARGEKVPYVRHLNRSKIEIASKSYIYHSPKNSLNSKEDCKVLATFLYIREKYGADSLEMEQFKSSFKQKACDYYYVQVLSDSSSTYEVGKVLRFTVPRQQKKFWLATLVEDAQNPKNKRSKAFNPFSATSYPLSLNPSKGANGRDWSSCSFIKDADKMGYLVSRDVVEALGQEFVSYDNSDTMEINFTADWHLEAFNQSIVTQLEELKEDNAVVNPTEDREDVISYINTVTSKMVDGSFFSEDEVEENENDLLAESLVQGVTASNVDSSELPF
tara:strand:+ start:388 stop:1362 length:975 start_codon:yes stop_codon:yes gene_type:complete